MEELPKKEVIEDIYKNKNPSKDVGDSKQMSNRKDNNKKNDIDFSKSFENRPKRRQGLFNLGIHKKEDEGKFHKAVLDLEEKNKETENRLSKLNPIIQLILKFESSVYGIILIIIMGILSLFYYDVKEIAIPAKYDIVNIVVISFFFVYHIFDLIFRNIFLEKGRGSFYFKFQIFSVLTFIFDYNMVIFFLLKIILIKIRNKKNVFLSHDNFQLIIYILNILQLFKFFRFIKIYLMINKLFNEIDKKKKFNEIMELKKKNQKNKLGINLQQRLSKVKTTINMNQNLLSISNNISVSNNNNNENISGTNNNKSEMPLGNTSVIPLNVDLPTQKLMKTKSFIVKTEVEADKTKSRKLMEKINEKFQQTRMAKRLNNDICQKLILMIFLFFLLYSVTKGDFISHKKAEYFNICKFLNNYGKIYKNSLNENNNNYIEKLKNKANYLIDKIGINPFPIIQIEYDRQILFRNESISNVSKSYHSGEYSMIFDKNDNSTLVMIEQKYYYRLNSIMNILKLIFIFASIYIINYSLNGGFYLLFLKPLNDINKVIDKVSKDPVNNKIITELKQNFKNKTNVKYEMKIVESALIKISGLIAIGYGEAGSAIIKKCITSNLGFDPMSTGNIIEAIFGFCFIHDFGDINEILEEETITFVNHICDIVHSCVDKFNGYTNKNIGDCFLLAWKVKNSDNFKINKSSAKNLFNQNNVNEELTELADCALLAFLNIFKKINKSRKILAYRKNPDIIKKFGPKYSIQLGFGLHYGWGIEGAIGSLHKIDCSYLSPNVNIAARLETATNIYDVDILFSGEFYELLSDFMKEKCRKIDVVTLKGSEKPINLYTVDLNKNIKPGKLDSKKDRMSLREKMEHFGDKKKKLWKKFEAQKKDKTIGEVYYNKSKGFREILENEKSRLFYDLFEEGLSYYIDGEWNEASSKLYRAIYLENNDGPTKTILEYMRKLKFQAPNDWDGYRVLTSKT